VYPAEAWKLHQEGTVIVSFRVAVNGIVHDAHVTKSTSPGVFDASALAAVTSWVYEPVLVNGKPVDTRAQALFRFVGNSSAPPLGTSGSAPPLGTSISAPPYVITHTSVTFDTLVDHLKDCLASEP
jgi:TonB family protein